MPSYFPGSGAVAGILPCATVFQDDESIVYASKKLLTSGSVNKSESASLQTLPLPSPKSPVSGGVSRQCKVSESATKYLKDGTCTSPDESSMLDPAGSAIVDNSALLSTFQNLRISETELVSISSSATSGDPGKFVDAATETASW